MFKRLIVTCAAAAGLVLVGSPTVRAETAQPYVIPVILSITGYGSFLGQGEQRALQLAEGVINATGGIRGRPVKMDFYDDQSNPQNSVQLLSGFMAEKPPVLIGSSISGPCRAMVPLVKQNGPVMYCLSPAIQPERGSFAFTATLSNADLIEATVRYFRLKGLKRPALMVSSDATGQDAENAVRKVLALPENKDVQVVSTVHFNTDDINVSAQIATVKAANPDFFLLWTTGTPVATAFHGMLQVGLDVPTATSSGNMTYSQMTQYANFLPKQLYFPSAQWVVRDPTLIPPAVQTRIKEFYAAYEKAGITPDFPSEPGWDAAMIITQALRTLGPDASASQVRDYIVHLKDFAGIDGIYDFETVPQRGLSVKNAVVTEWSAQAKMWNVVSELSGIPLH